VKYQNITKQQNGTEYFRNIPLSSPPPRALEKRSSRPAQQHKIGTDDNSKLEFVVCKFANPVHKRRARAFFFCHGFAQKNEVNDARGVKQKRMAFIKRI
jgi:hypothetical protein